MGFAGDDRAIVTETIGDPGVCGCVLFMGRIKFRAAACRESGKVETILERDRQTKEGEVGRSAAGCLALGFGDCPSRVEDVVGVVARVAVGAREACLGLGDGVGLAGFVRSEERGDGRRLRRHWVIVEGTMLAASCDRGFF